MHRCGIVALWMASRALIKSKTRYNGNEEITNNCSGIFISGFLYQMAICNVLSALDCCQCLNLMETIFSK